MSVYTIFVNQHLHCLVPNITWYQERTNQVKIHSRSWVSRRIRNLVIWKTCCKDQEKWSLPNAPNLAVTWKRWKQKMEFYLTALMRGKTGEKNAVCSCFQLVSKEEMCSTQGPGRRKEMLKVIQDMKMTLQWDNF